MSYDNFCTRLTGPSHKLDLSPATLAHAGRGSHVTEVPKHHVSNAESGRRPRSRGRQSVSVACATGDVHGDNDFDLASPCVRMRLCGDPVGAMARQSPRCSTGQARFTRSPWRWSPPVAPHW